MITTLLCVIVIRYKDESIAALYQNNAIYQLMADIDDEYIISECKNILIRHNYIYGIIRN